MMTGQGGNVKRLITGHGENCGPDYDNGNNGCTTSSRTTQASPVNHRFLKGPFGISSKDSPGLAKPTERLKDFKIVMKPMVGCMGVAPGNSASFRNAWLGACGGNMDYDEIGEGTTLYLPVAREGALLCLGDVHVEEGDGELNGNALETSADVEFTVDVIPGVSTLGPRAENDEYLMCQTGSLS